MKKMLVAAALLLSTVAFSQTDKGDLMVGGSAGFRTNKGYSDFSLQPNVGYFFANNFAAGANFQVTFNKTGNVKNTEYRIKSNNIFE